MNDRSEVTKSDPSWADDGGGLAKQEQEQEIRERCGFSFPSIICQLLFYCHTTFVF